jgi:nitrite reductase/ring-hydroxylating ferredoxin subunit
MSEPPRAKVPRRLRRYVEDLLRGRRPRAFAADEDEAAQIHTAITLRAARPGSGAPSEEFVTALRRRLATELDPADGRQPARTPSRRRIVQAASAAAAAAAVVGAVGGAVVEHAVAPTPGTDAGGTALEPNTGTWHTVAASVEVSDGTTRPFDVGTVVGFVTRAGGRLSAVMGVCSHQGCRLALNGAARELACPCHNAAFTVTGTLVRHQLPIAPKALAMLRVREVDGEIQVYAP